MKRFILILLICAMLVGCLVSCKRMDMYGRHETPVLNDILIIDEKNEQLNDFFYQMQMDARETEKIEFSVQNQEAYYENKESEENESADWPPSRISILIQCDYDLAINESWYIECEDKSFAALNTAFFNEYCEGLNEHFVLYGIGEALKFNYDHSENELSDAINEFNSDFSILKQLVNLDYVTEVYVTYYYGLPVINRDE